MSTILQNLEFVSVWLGECGFNLWSTPRRGRAPKGKRARLARLNTPGKNLTLVVAVCALYGLVEWMFVEGVLLLTRLIYLKGFLWSECPLLLVSLSLYL